VESDTAKEGTDKGTPKHDAQDGSSPKPLGRRRSRWARLLARHSTPSRPKTRRGCSSMWLRSITLAPANTIFRTLLPQGFVEPVEYSLFTQAMSLGLTMRVGTLGRREGDELFRGG
jgi:hypothetical protein